MKRNGTASCVARSILREPEHPGGIAIEQQAQQHLGGIGLSTACPIPGIQGRQVKLGHAVYHEAGQMVGGQTVAQPHRQIECLLVVHRFEGSTHVHQYTITDGGLLFSDKLLGQAYMHLHQVSLLDELSGEQVRLHPLVRAFGLRLIAMDDSEGKSFLEKAGKRLADTCTDLMWLEERARSQGYRECLEHIRLVGAYLEWLGEITQAEVVKRVERWMDRESYLLADPRWWPEVFPELFYQQLTNRSLEAGQPVLMRNAPSRWIRQTGQVTAEDSALLRLCSGHTDWVNSVAFSPDGKLLASGLDDRTIRLWEVSSGKQLAQLEGHRYGTNCVAFSPDGKLLVSASSDTAAQLWEVSSGKQLARLQGYTHRVNHVAFSLDGRLTISCSKNGQVYFWQAHQPELAHLLGIFVANYEIRAIHWQDERHVFLADIGPQGRPHFYWLVLEGM